MKSDVEAIRREVGRAAGLIERFLVFARARTVHPHAQPIEPIVREAVEVVGPGRGAGAGGADGRGRRGAAARSSRTPSCSARRS